jgi:hypothetical protein
VARKDLAGGAWPTRGDYLDSLGLLGSEGARTGVGGHRGESSASTGAATAARRGCWRPLPVLGERNGALRRTRGGARARRLPVGVELAATGRHSGLTAEPDSTPRAAASTVPAVGLRTRERVYGGWLGAFGATKDAVSSFIPYPR